MGDSHRQVMGDTYEGLREQGLCGLVPNESSIKHYSKQKGENEHEEWSNRHDSVRNSVAPLSSAPGENYKSTAIWSL